jgi:transposase-like protein
MRSWLRQRTTAAAATALVREILTTRFPGSSTGVDTAVAAAAVGVHEATVRRWMRVELDPSAALTATRRIVLAIAPSARVQSVDLPAACAGLGVQPGTVRRWLRTTADRAPLPRARAEQLLTLTAPTEQILVRERLQVQHAHDNITRLGLGRGGGGMTAQYGETGWLEPHIVAVLQLPGTGLHRVSTTRLSERTLQRMRQTGEVEDFTTEPLPHKFAATLLRDELLQAVAGWRVQTVAGAVEALDRGHTQTWVVGAPQPSLDQLARRLNLRD